MEPAAEIDLDPVQQRVIGSLLEKERTVPDTYPMTLNGLRTACNQSSGRDPVMQLSDTEVADALTELRAMGLTRVIHPSHGARQPKFRQVLDEVLHLDDGARAVITLLLLRGPQTPGELRSRADRLHRFDSVDEVDAVLASLADGERPLVRELPRRPGQKEARWVHLLGQPPAAEATTPTSDADGNAHADDRGELERLRAENQQLRTEVAALRAELDRARRELDELSSG